MERAFDDLQLTFNAALVQSMCICNIFVVEDVQVTDSDPRGGQTCEVRSTSRHGISGYILQSDHSMPDNVDPQTYDYVIELVREYGNYPLQLGEYDRDISPVS